MLIKEEVSTSSVGDTRCRVVRPKMREQILEKLQWDFFRWRSTTLIQNIYYKNDRKAAISSSLKYDVCVYSLRRTDTFRLCNF